MIPEFVDLLDIAIKELQTEDEYLRGAVAANPGTYPSNGKGNLSGLLRFNNERYYQYVVGKGLLRSYPYIVGLEKGKEMFDLTLKGPGQVNGFYAAVEMKRYMTPAGKVEPPEIQRDIQELLNAKARLENAMILIFSANLRQISIIEKNLKDLAKELNTDRDNWEYRFFPTFSNEGESVYFWIAGYEVPLISPSGA